MMITVIVCALVPCTLRLQSCFMYATADVEESLQRPAEGLLQSCCNDGPVSQSTVLSEDAWIAIDLNDIFDPPPQLKPLEGKGRACRKVYTPHCGFFTSWALERGFKKLTPFGESNTLPLGCSCSVTLEDREVSLHRGINALLPLECSSPIGVDIVSRGTVHHHGYVPDFPVPQAPASPLLSLSSFLSHAQFTPDVLFFIPFPPSPFNLPQLEEAAVGVWQTPLPIERL